MFKFKGISSEDMQVIIEEEEHFIARASQRYETIEIEGRDGAIFNELGYSVVERPIYVQCLNINKIDDILAWLNGEGEFEYKGRKTTARFYSQLEPQRSSCIRIIDTTFIRDPFWYKANEEYILSKDRKDKTVEGEIIDITDSAEAKITELKISGNSKQETSVQGKNMLDVAIFDESTDNGITLTRTKGTNKVTLNGTTTTSFTIHSNDLDISQFEVGKTYTLSISTDKCKYSFEVFENDSSSASIWSNSITMQSTYTRIRTYLQQNSAVTFDNEEIALQFEEGKATEIEDFTPDMPSPDYPSEVQAVGDNGSINEVICNKNLAVIESGGIATATGLEMVASNYYKSNFIQVLNNKTFTGSYNTNASSKQVVMFEYDKDKNFLRFSNTNSSSHTATVGDDTKYIRYRFSTEPNIKPTQVQIEEGSIATPYQEHKEQTYTIPTQQPFRTIGDIRDTFIKKNNKWFERHYSYRLILDGTETWQLESVGRFGITRSKLPKIPKAVANNNAYIGNMCNYYKESTPTLTWGKKQGFCFDISSCLRIYDNTYSSNNDLEGFKSWLSEKYNAGTPVYVDYILETPNDIECTEEQSTILWDIEQNAKTYDKVTHIYSTDEVSPNIEVTYFTPTDETISNEGNIQSRPILRLEKTVSEAVELTINDIRFKYDFGDDEYVEIDCEEKAVEYEGLNRNRRISIGYEFPKLNIGNNKIIMHDGDCIIKILRKDRWL